MKSPLRLLVLVISLLIFYARVSTANIRHTLETHRCTEHGNSLYRFGSNELHHTLESFIINLSVRSCLPNKCSGKILAFQNLIVSPSHKEGKSAFIFVILLELKFI